MKILTDYLNSLPTKEQIAYASRCGTSVGYLRKAASKGQRLGESLCIELDRESAGVVRCELLRPDVDWTYLENRNTKYPSAPELAQQEVAICNGPQPAEPEKEPSHA